MKSLRSKLTYSNVMVTVLAVVVLGGGTAYAATSMLPKSSVGAAQIKKGAVTPTKLSASAKAALTSKGATGAQGPKGDLGPRGDTGQRGDTGPQGPGATTLVYDANASASPSKTTVGTVLGDTFSAECLLEAGEAKLSVYVATSDGSLKWDIGTVATDNGVNTSRSTSIDAPPGTVSSPTLIAAAAAEAGANKSDHQTQIVQLGTQRGYLNLHSAATTTTTPATAQTCHFSVLAFPSA